jgi:hypothetical protein
MAARPERKVIENIDALVDWEMTDSDAAKTEHEPQAPELEQWLTDQQAEADHFAALSAASACESRRRLMSLYRKALVLGYSMGIANGVAFTADVAPLLWHGPPLMFTSVNLVVTVWMSRWIVNTHRVIRNLAAKQRETG